MTDEKPDPQSVTWYIGKNLAMLLTTEMRSTNGGPIHIAESEYLALGATVVRAVTAANGSVTYGDGMYKIQIDVKPKT